MKYVCVSYNPETNRGEVAIYNDDMIDRKFTEFQQDFIVYQGRTLPVMFASEYDNKVRDFATILRVGYQGLVATEKQYLKA